VIYGIGIHVAHLYSSYSWTHHRSFGVCLNPVLSKRCLTLRSFWLRGLKKLASVTGDVFKMGVLLYDGTETMPMGDGLWAVPLSTLWGR
jgi:hypothetical protein